MNYRYKVIAIVTPLLFLITLSPSHAREKGSLEQCQEIKNTIDYYAKLRRQGGSASSMDIWKKKLNEYDDEYTQADCKRWKGRLR